MFKFSEVEVSKAIANGTNISCIEDRFVVCRLKKDFIVNTANNRVMFEKDDIVICTGDYDSKEWWLRLLDEQQLKSMSSEDFIKSPTSWLTYDGYKAQCSLDEFKETFEVCDDETKLVESHVKVAKKSYYALNETKDKVRSVEYHYESKESLRQALVSILLIVTGVAGMVCSVILLHGIVKGSVFFTLSVILLGIGLFGVAATSADDEVLSCFKIRNKSKLDEAQKEYDAQLNASAAALNALRSKDGWYTGA